MFSGHVATVQSMDYSSLQIKQKKYKYILESVVYEQAFNPHFGKNLTNHFVFLYRSWTSSNNKGGVSS